LLNYYKYLPATHRYPCYSYSYSDIHRIAIHNGV